MPWVPSEPCRGWSGANRSEPVFPKTHRPAWPGAGPELTASGGAAKVRAMPPRSKRRLIPRRRSPPSSDRARVLGYTFSVLAILFGLGGVILPLPLGLTGILLALIADMLLRRRWLPWLALAVAVLGTAGGFLLGWVL